MHAGEVSTIVDDFAKRLELAATLGMNFQLDAEGCKSLALALRVMAKEIDKLHKEKDDAIG